MNERIIKYPKTPHIEGSKMQKGDEDLSKIPFSKIKDKFLVIEEKVDGANVAVSFSDSGKLLLQSRGHFLTGGAREKHYDLFKIWANQRLPMLYEILKSRYIMYGEWLYVKHKIYYDSLPDYFLEFDIFDKEKGAFLSTDKRHSLLKDTNISSVPVLASGKFNKIEDILKHLKNSQFVTINRLENLKNEIKKQGLDEQKILEETDLIDLAEGLYIKVEEGDVVVDRLKYVRSTFTQPNVASQNEWLKMKILVNKLKVL